MRSSSSILENENRENLQDLTTTITPPIVPANNNGGGTPKRDQLRKILQVAKSVRQGNFSARFPIEEEGIPSEISDVFNDILELNEHGDALRFGLLLLHN